MTEQEFRRNNTLVRGMREFFESGTGQAVVEVLIRESPLKKREQFGETAYLLGRIQAADETISRLQSLSEFLPTISVNNEEV